MSSSFDLSLIVLIALTMSGCGAGVSVLENAVTLYRHRQITKPHTLGTTKSCQNPQRFI